MDAGSDKNRALIENLPDAFAYHRIITDSSGNPVDYIFLDVNPAFHEMTGLSRDDVMGKRVTEVHPDIKESSFDWIATYGKVALTGESARFEQYFEPPDCWYDITAYSDEPGYFAVVFRDITLQKKSKMGQEILLDNIETQIWYLKDEKTYGPVNQSHADFFGAQKEELENKSLYDLMSTREEAETCIAGNQEVFSKKQKIHSEELVLNGKGESRLLSITKTPKLDANNNVEYVVCSAEDITERKQLEIELHQSEALFQKMLSVVQDMISIHDRNMNIIYSNWNGFGAVPEEKRVLNTKCYRTYRGHDDICPDCQAIEVLKTGEAFQKEMELSGGMWVDLRIIPILGHDSSVELFVEWVRDITESKKAEDELKRFKVISDNAVYGKAIADIDGKLVYVNNFLAGIHGYTPDELLGEYLSIFHTTEQFEKVDRTIAHMLGSGHFEPQEIWHVHRNGTVFPMLMSGVVIRDEQNNPKYITCSVIDITDRKKAEEELQRSTEELEQQRDDLNKRLHQSVNAISKIGELRDAYTAGHQKRVAELACAIGSEMGFVDEQINNLSFGALIHDIGKFLIPSDILNKPGKITDLEYRILQTHVEESYNVVKEIDFPEEIHNMIYQHHERLDGSGYPQGLTGDKIIMESRILAVADVVEAMASHRPYRAALGIDAALEEILLHRGTKYDAEVVDICIKLFKEDGYAF